MFSSNQFEPTSGGGFMSSQPSQASEASTAAKGLVPLTVKQLDQSGIVLSDVSLVGIVCDKDDSRVSDIDTSSLNTDQASPLNQDFVFLHDMRHGYGRKNLDDMILDYLKQPACSARLQGIHLDEIARHLKTPKDKLEGVIQSLETEGLIYSTIDDYHFKLVQY